MTAYLRFSTDVNGAVSDHPQRNLKDLSRVISKARSRKREIRVGADGLHGSWVLQSHMPTHFGALAT